MIGITAAMSISSTCVNPCGKECYHIIYCKMMAITLIQCCTMAITVVYGDVQSPLALDGRLCGTPSTIPYSPLRQSCLPLFNAFQCAKPPLTFSSTAQSCFSFLLCIHNGSTVVTIKHL